MLGFWELAEFVNRWMTGDISASTEIGNRLMEREPKDFAFGSPSFWLT
jgi:hypothetical protein